MSTEILRSKRSDKTLAVATGTLVAQGSTMTAADFATAIDASGVLRRTEEVEVHQNDTVTELRCQVEYGPVFGAYESDLRRQLKAIHRDGEVLNFSRRELGPEDLAEVLTKVDDIRLPLKARKLLSDSLSRLRAAAAPDQS